MDITELSLMNTQASTMNAVGFAVLDMSMETVEEAGDSMEKMMEQSVTPHLGQNIDVSV